MFEESFAESWTARYGRPPGFEVPELARLLAHRTVRRYTDEPISPEVRASLFAAAQSASTSSNLQLWSAVAVEDAARRARLAEVSGRQRQVEVAPLVLVFLADAYRMSRLGEGRATGLDYAEVYTTAVVDATLAAERLVCAAEALGYGACYVGGMRNDPEAVGKTLELPEGVFGLFGLTIGRPDPARPTDVKPRLPQSAVFFTDRYDGEAGIGDYDERMREFYREQRMTGEERWSERSTGRLTEESLGKRVEQLGHLQEKGFIRR